MPLDSLQKLKVEEAIFEGRKIEAIKLYREADGCGLKEAKEAVEKLESELRQNTAHRFEKAEVRGGCFGMLVFCAILAGVAVGAGAWLS